MKTYVLMISEVFPKTHKRAGEKTNFLLSIKHYDKIHTLRSNYDLWKKRFDEIDAGKAVLSIRVWAGKPYQSKQQEIFIFDRRKGIGIEKIIFRDYFYDINVNKVSVDIDLLAENDGLSFDDFEDWFSKYDLSKPIAVIHFTDFRYSR